MSDLIDRQLVLKAIDEYERLSAVSQTVRNMTSLREIVEQLPSAQPDVPDTNVGDTISRQAVVDTVHKTILGFFSEEDGTMTDTEKTLLSVNKAICNGVRELPSSQPEIIRCKECANADENYHCDYMTTWNYGDCFCSYGKRRTDDLQ